MKELTASVDMSNFQLFSSAYIVNVGQRLHSFTFDHRPTYMFILFISVTFSTDDDVVVSLSCIGYSPADPSNKFFVALCYKMQVCQSQCC